MRVNGREHQVPEPIVLADLLLLLGFPGDGVAAALDGEIVPRARYRDAPVRDGAEVEIVRAVGGG